MSVAILKFQLVLESDTDSCFCLLLEGVVQLLSNEIMNPVYAWLNISPTKYMMTKKIIIKQNMTIYSSIMQSTVATNPNNFVIHRRVLNRQIVLDTGTCGNGSTYITNVAGKWYPLISTSDYSSFSFFFFGYKLSGAKQFCQAY